MVHFSLIMKSVLLQTGAPAAEFCGLAWALYQGTHIIKASNQSKHKGTHSLAGREHQSYAMISIRMQMGLDQYHACKFSCPWPSSRGDRGMYGISQGTQDYHRQTISAAGLVMGGLSVMQTTCILVPVKANCPKQLPRVDLDCSLGALHPARHCPESFMQVRVDALTCDF